MPIYTARMDTALAINTTIELDLKVTGQNIAANQTNFSYSLKIKKNNNYNDNFKGNAEIWFNVGGNQVMDGAQSSWTIHGGDHGGAASTSYTLKTGTFSVTHNSDGSKTANVSVLVDPNVSNAGGSWGTREQMRIEQSMVLTKINRNVSFTLSPSSISLGNTLTVSVSNGQSTNYHQAYLYVDGKSHLIGTRTGNGSVSSTIPSTLVSSATAKTVSGSVRVFSYTSLSNLTSLGSPTRAISVYIPANAPIAPTLTQSVVTGTGLPSGFMVANEYISGWSVLNATVQGASAQSGSTINLYEVRVVLTGTNTTIMSGTSTTSTVSLGTVPQVTPEAGQAVDVITRVRDNRSIWSSEKKQTSLMRFHKYSAASGSGTTKRSGTNAIVDISWSVTSIKQSGTTEKNSAKIYIDTKERSSTSWTNKYANASAALSGTYKATLTGYSTTTSYDVRLRVIDGLGTTTVNLNSLGTESVPLDATQGGIGIGTIHSGSGANLQVGSNGINNEGSLISYGETQLHDTTRIIKDGVYNQLGMGAYYGASSTNTGAITLTMPPNHNGMFSATINIRSYSYSAVLEVAGYTYTGSTSWYTPQMIGNIDGADINVRFRTDGAKARYITIGEIGTAWGGYLQVTVENVKSGYGGAFPGPINVSLETSWPGNKTDGTFYLRKLFNTANDGSGSGLDADLLDGKHASTIISEAIAGVTIPTGGAATTGAVSGRGRWFQSGDLLICTQVAFINTYFSAYSLTGSWTYPKAFAEAPFVQVAGGHDGMADNTYRMNGALNAYSVTSTGTSVHFAGGTFASGNSKRVYMLAIGRP